MVYGGGGVWCAVVVCGVEVYGTWRLFMWWYVVMGSRGGVS